MTDVLRDFLLQHKKAALAFSGGTDSSYLLWKMTQCGTDVTAYYVHSPFQPAFELKDARNVAAYAGARMQVLEVNILDCAAVRENPKNRCYFCKQQIFGAIRQAALADGYETLFDGTNASDDADDRPGMKALAELKVLSPLRICGLTKDDVRRRSKEAGLFTWDKPAYACLATRIPAGMPITKEALVRTEEAETFLHRTGFRDFRVRTTREGNALVQVTAAQKEKAEAEWETIRDVLLTSYPDVTLDTELR